MLNPKSFRTPHSALRISSIVPVAMMDVGIVGVIVGQFSMVMDMGVRFAGRIGWLVRVLVMLIVPVEMLMRHWFMAVRVDVVLGQMEPYADQHEAARSPEKQRRLLV
jgi:xanthosine utilization system XapX-like protein